jgi:hypothetical protein
VSLPTDTTAPPRFAHPYERRFAELLDFYGVRWLYEPRTFILERGADGSVASAITPDFFLPDHDLFLELTTLRQRLVTKKNRKIRQLREKYPYVTIQVLYQRQLQDLMARHGLSLT